MLKIFQRRKKFSLENLKYLYGVLEKNATMSSKNEQLILNTLQQIAELMVWGDQHNDQFFFYLAEKNILSFFLRIIESNYHRSVIIQVMQTLNIMIQNISKQMSLYYLFSNNYINDIIVHDFDFTDTEILNYYVSFLKTLSLKLDEDVINFFFNSKAHDFPLYTEGIKFFNNGDQMVRIAVRTLTLNVYRVNDNDLRKYLSDRNSVPFFSNLVWFIRDECLNLNELLRNWDILEHGNETHHNPTTLRAVTTSDGDVNIVRNDEEKKERDGAAAATSSGSGGQTNGVEESESDQNTGQNKSPPLKKPPPALPPSSRPGGPISSVPKKTLAQIKLEEGIEEQVDHYYYLEDILEINLKSMSSKLIDQLLGHFVIPVLIGSLRQALPDEDDEKDGLYDGDHDETKEDSENDDDEKEDGNNDASSSDRPQPHSPSSNGQSRATDLRKKRFETRRTISLQLSLFLLSQILKVFSDSHLVNAICACMFHPYPPRLVNQIVMSPPDHPVDSEIPLAYILSRRRGERRGSASMGSFVDNFDEDGGSDGRQSQRSVVDWNVQNPRSRQPSLSKFSVVVDDDSSLAEDKNIYRNALFALLDHENALKKNDSNGKQNMSGNEGEQLIASVCAVILTAIRNEKVDHDILIDANMCPQRRQKDVLETATTSSAVVGGVRYPSELISALLKILSISHRLSIFTIRVVSELLETMCCDESLENNGLSAEHYDYLMNNVWRGAQEYVVKMMENCRAARRSCSVDGAAVADIGRSSPGLEGTLDEVMLNNYFLDTFEEEWNSFIKQPKIENLIKNPIRILPPQVFETAAAAPHSTGNSSSMTTSPTNRPPPPPPPQSTEKPSFVGDHQASNSKQDEADGAQQPQPTTSPEVVTTKKKTIAPRKTVREEMAKRFEKMRKAIINLLHLCRLRNSFVVMSPPTSSSSISSSTSSALATPRSPSRRGNKKITFPFTCVENYTYYPKYQVELSRVAPGSLNCVVLNGGKQLDRVLFCVREADWLLLFTRLSGRAGYATTYCAVQIHCAEAFLSKSDPRVIHIAIRSSVRPHPTACVKVPNTKNKWSLTLFFDNYGKESVSVNGNAHHDALTALNYCEQNRMRLRRRMMNQLLSVLEFANEDGDANEDAELEIGKSVTDLVDEVIDSGGDDNDEEVDVEDGTAM